MFFFQSVEKALRETLTQAAWNGLLFTTQISQSDCEIRTNCAKNQSNGIQDIF